MIPIGGSEHSDYSEPPSLMGRYSDILTENKIYIFPFLSCFAYIFIKPSRYLQRLWGRFPAKFGWIKS